MHQISILKALHAKRGALVGELERSLAIQALWPEAFTQGACRGAWHSIYGREAWYVLTRSDGETQTFQNSEVPACIARPAWPRGHNVVNPNAFGHKQRSFK